MGCNGSKTAGSAAGEQNNAPKDSPKSEQSTAEPTTPKKDAQQKGYYICILYYIFFLSKSFLFSSIVTLHFIMFDILRKMIIHKSSTPVLFAYQTLS